jgi:LCP family protein required for cell wall assembly
MRINFLKQHVDDLSTAKQIFTKTSIKNEWENIPLPSKKPSKKLWLYISIFILLTIIGFSTKIIISSSEAVHSFGAGGILTQFKNFFTKSNKDIAGHLEDRVNVLILGIGGAGHQGPNLTDAIILLSIKPQTKEAAFLSIPRDLYVKNDELGGGKINGLYSLEEIRHPGMGGLLIKKTVGALLDIKINYYLKIDFNGFRDLINAIGGLDIYVPKSFVDYNFPTTYLGIQTVSFVKGWNHFDGEKALQYARSRHGTNGEGSDFARAERQQKILLALKKEILSLGFILRPDKIDRVIQFLGTSIETDLEIWEIVKLAQLVNQIKDDKIVQKVLSDDPEGPLQTITGIDGAYLLMPKHPKELQSIAQNIFVINKIKTEKPTIVIRNGTTVPGLAKLTQESLEKNGFTILKIENAEQQNYSKSIIFDLTRGAKLNSLKLLQQQLDAYNSNIIPNSIWQENVGADFVVILGK